jgi:transketolase C-terminal domain/subunit
LATLDERPPQLFLGFPNQFGMTGEYADILEHYRLTGTGIAENVAARLQKQKCSSAA